MQVPRIDVRMAAESLPFRTESLDAVFMLNALHHMPATRQLFAELSRALKPGGRVVLLEPASTLWARFIWRFIHYENYDRTAGWDTDGSSPLLSANAAIPWIIFVRDRRLFEQRYPLLRIVRVQPHTPLKFLVSGGTVLKPLVPLSAYGWIEWCERLLAPCNCLLGMYLTIELQKQVREVVAAS